MNKIIAIIALYLVGLTAFSMDETSLLSNDVNEMLLQLISELKDSDRDEDLSLVECLINKGADPNATGRGGFTTPLTIASSGKNLKLLKLLIDNKANVNKTALFVDFQFFIAGRISLSPLAVALLNNQEDNVKMLRMAGAQLAQSDPPEAQSALDKILNPDRKTCMIM